MVDERHAGPVTILSAIAITDESPEPERMMQSDHETTRHPPPATRHLIRWAVLVAAATMTLAYFAYDRYEVSRLAGAVRNAFAARRYDEARGLVQRWIRERPGSADARYYAAWLALVDERPGEAVEAIEQASRLGYDPARLGLLKAIYQARGGQVTQAEPVLREAFERNREPRTEVARELARIYLTTYRLPYAAVAVERCRTLMPEDPQPYLWSNEIVTRTYGDPSILIRNYRAALERDPSLDDARRGLARQLSKELRFDEADQEYRELLRRDPKDASALVGLGRNAFHQGNLDGAVKEFEAALKVDPRHLDALKELAQADLRLGRFDRGVPAVRAHHPGRTL